MIKLYCKKKLSSQTSISSHSTVTDFVDTTKFSPYNSINNNVESILLKFELDIRTSKLAKTSNYNLYQHKLYRLIKYLKA